MTKSFLALLLCTFGLELNSCSFSVTTGDPVQRTSAFNWHDPQFSNVSNPYDWVGALHNQGLNYVAARVNFASCSDSLYPHSDTVAVFFADSALGLSSSSFSTNLHMARLGFTNFGAIPTPSVGNEVQLAMWVLDSLTLEVSNEDSAMAGIVQLEADAIANFNSSDKDFFLPIVAIARYSMAYWSSTDASQWPTGDLHLRATEAAGTTVKGSHDIQWCWGLNYAYGGLCKLSAWMDGHPRVYNDILGAAGGAALGSGTGPGAAACAAIGAIVSSSSK